MPILLFAALVMAAGWFAVRRLPRPDGTAVGAPSGSALEAIRLALGPGLLRGPMLLAAATGVFHGGSFLVLLPLLIREGHGGGSVWLGAAHACFMLGTLAGIALLQLLPAALRPGRVLLASVGLGSLALALLPTAAPTAYLLPLVVGWGLCGGIGMVMSRSIVQQAAPASHRGRVLGVYSLASFGGLPLGSLLLGQLAGWLGTGASAQGSAALVLLVTATVALTTPLIRARST
ncbi:MAG: MFS transporter [Gammaproteobacteria bacterium]|nr:MFS transporter [Gammaproteobacteria bacterium]